MEGDEEGSPLVEAAAAGTLETLQELLATTIADVNAQDQKGDTALHAACANGRVAVVRWLLDNGARLDVKNKTGDSALHVAASGGDVALMEMLMASVFAGGDVQNEHEWTPAPVAAKAESVEILRSLVGIAADVRLPMKSGDDSFYENGCSLLHVAASTDNVDAIKFLVKEVGAEVDFRNEGGRTALQIAAACGSLGAVRELLASGAMLEVRDQYGESPLYRAAEAGHGCVVKYLLEAGADVSVVGLNGLTPLHGAARSGDIATIELLVERRADVHALEVDGWSVLHSVTQSGSKEAVEFFVRRGQGGDFVDINAATVDGTTGLHCAAAAGYTEIIEMLLELGANLHAVDERGWSALHDAACGGSVAAIELLLREGADINAIDKAGASVLQVAAQFGSVSAANFLLREGADATTEDKTDGYSTFHNAALGGSVDLMKVFLEFGADMNALTKEGETALHLACSNGGREAVEYLVKLGMDPNISDDKGKTSLHHAAEAGDGECISFLLTSGAKSSIDKPDKDGYRALHSTANLLHVQETEALLQAGADIHALTNDGESPLQLAVFTESRRSALSTVSLLCRFGAQWTSKCQAKLMRTKEELEAGEVDVTDQLYKHLEWYMGLRACILHWEQQYRDGIKALTKVPLEVIRRGEVSVRTYIADATSSDADELVYRCKVCVVGPSEWGKSSLVRSIETMKPFLVDTKDRTVGIELVATSLRGSEKTELVEDRAKPSATPETDDEAGESTTNQERSKHHEVTFWDFAGQDVYQVAHSLFFSRRTVYVLVVDVKAYLDQLDAIASLRSGAAEAAMNRFLSRFVFRWVRSIFARQPDAEFLVVGTKADLLKDEEKQSARVWRDLQSRIYKWKVDYMREIEKAYGVVTNASGALTGHNATMDQTGGGTSNAHVQELTEKLAHLASDQWIVVSITRRGSIDAVRQALRHAIEASERGFPMYKKYSRVLKTIADMRTVLARSGDEQRRIDEGMMKSRRLSEKLMDEVPDLEYDECHVILRTLHDLGDVIWYEGEEAGNLRDYVILDPMLIIDIVREVISHEHVKKSGVVVESKVGAKEEQPRLDGRVAHAHLKSLTLWKHMDTDMVYAFKMLLKQFQLAYSADDGVMEAESDLIVPSYWKLQLEAAVGNATLPAVAADPHLSRRGDCTSLTYHHCWEYEVPADLSDSIFEQFAVQSDATDTKRAVRAGAIETSCVEFQSWITLTTGPSRHDVIRVEVASETMDIAWHSMRYYLMKLEKVLDGYSGLAVSRYVIVDNERHSLSPAIKAARDSIDLSRDVNDLRVKMPWLPPDLEWYTSRAWRDLNAFQNMQLMHLVQEKLNVLQKLVVKGDSQRRYPALWSLDYVAEQRVVVLRMMSDLSGRCHHPPIEIEVPPAFLAKHGSKIKEGISLLANVVPSSLSLPILQTAIDAAKSHLEAKTQQATQIHNLIDRLDLTTTGPSNSIMKSIESGLSPGGTMAILRDLLKLHNDSLDELSITDICNLECAATSEGDYVWAHPYEIKMLKGKLTPCQPQFEADSESGKSTSSEPHQEPESSKLSLSLCIESVTGLTNWDWYKTYCTWQLFYGNRKTPLTAGATSTNADSSVQPSWSSLKSTIDAIDSVEMLQECRLLIRVKRRSHIGWTKTIGEGQVELRSLVSVDDKLAFKCDPIRVTLPASGSGSTERVVLCQISN